MNLNKSIYFQLSPDLHNFATSQLDDCLKKRIEIVFKEEMEIQLYFRLHLHIESFMYESTK